MDQIQSRKNKIYDDVHEVDKKYNLNDPSFLASNRALHTANQAIFKQFQQQAGDGGFEDDLPTNYKWDNTLKERLNFVDARQQNHLFQMFKEEDFVHKIWDEGGPDHRTMMQDSDEHRHHHS